MGYRIDIEDGVNEFYNTKHYGYCDEKSLPSYKYLVDIGIFDGYEVFCDGCLNEIELTPNEFEHFIKLYADEYKSRKGYDILEDEDIIALRNSNKNKQICWL